LARTSVCFENRDDTDTLALEKSGAPLKTPLHRGEAESP
jgi:hypothetical protein